MPDNAIALRPLIRDVLRAAKRPLNLPALHAQLRVLDPGAVLKDTEAALEFNLRKGNVTFEHNEELDADLWSLTTRGKQA